MTCQEGWLTALTTQLQGSGDPPLPLAAVSAPQFAKPGPALRSYLGWQPGPQHLFHFASGALTPRTAIPTGHMLCQAPIHPPQPLTNPTLTASTCRACAQQIPADPANPSPMAESLQREGKLSPACTLLLQIRQAEKQLD